MQNLLNTYSIVARDPETGQFGVAVQTHQMGVGRVVPWMIAGVGAIATQAMLNASFGPVGLELLKAGVSAEHVIASLVASDPNAHRRQVAVVDAHGRAAAYTGTGCIAAAAHHVGEGYSVQANMMTHDTVVPAMAEAFEQAQGDLAQRMLAAMVAAQAQGGDIRGMQSAALRVVAGVSDRPSWATDYDLRVDEHDTPVEELARLVRLRRAQLDDTAGHQKLAEGDRDAAFALWAQARQNAPELEELGFWQAVALADEHADINAAVSILKPVLANDPRREHWIDLIGRLDSCGLMAREGAAADLVEALNA